MSSIYLKVTIGKSDIPKTLKSQFLESRNSHRYHWIFKLFLQVKNQRCGSKTVCLFYYFNFDRNAVFKSKSPCFLWNKNINFNKNESGLKIENPTHNFREMKLKLQLIQESRLKSKTVMRCSSRKKKCIFLNVYFVQKNFFNILV